MHLVLFDLDGTLIHSEAGIVGSIRYAIAQMGLDAPPLETLRTWIGPPLRQSFPSVVGDDHARVEEAVAHYRVRFDSLGWAEHEVYEGIPAVVEALATQGKRLAVVTTKMFSQARKIIDHLPFGHHFEQVYAPTGDGQHSEKAAMIARALADFSVDPARTAMIGDRYFDIEGARANGVRAVGVTWGFGSREELKGAGADAVVSHPSELAPALVA
ncbi:HAD hydrolase-like protein [Tahibacter amnicola]|uniref:HAD hydrolase-like protein n=1 Tax=Tahibacter amnicola TaxID=2976241 RepID=A0ABY6BGE9_9GAMM|nr:HAD hydrolase-like protein [Tahibacter amnicola]UXI68910.1 HAD hydrolase-like protein [Tahibacter amnicola]